MIPLRDNVPSATTPFVTWGLMAVCAVVYLHQLNLGRYHTGQYRVLLTSRGPVKRPITLDDRFIERWGAIPSGTLKGYIEQVRQPSGFLSLSPRVIRQRLTWRDRLVPLVTSLFLHGSLLHLLGNMLFLFIFGDSIEDRLGHGRYLAFYIGGGVFASMAHIVLSPSSTIPVIGASGAISAVLGAYFLLYPRATVVTFIPLPLLWPIIHVPALLFLGLWFLRQLTSGFGALAGASGHIAWWAHIGGFAFGLGLAFRNYSKWRVPRRRYGRARTV